MSSTAAKTVRIVFPDNVKQEIQTHIIAVNCRELVHQGKECKEEAQFEKMRKQHHGSENHTSLLKQPMDGKPPCACCFDREPLQNNREGNEERSNVDGATAMLKLKEMSHCVSGSEQQKESKVEAVAEEPIEVSQQAKDDPKAEAVAEEPVEASQQAKDEPVLKDEPAVETKAVPIRKEAPGLCLNRPSVVPALEAPGVVSRRESALSFLQSSTGTGAKSPTGTSTKSPTPSTGETPTGTIIEADKDRRQSTESSCTEITAESECTEVTVQEKVGTLAMIAS